MHTVMAVAGVYMAADGFLVVAGMGISGASALQ
jgi:hypothetical protein